MLVLIAAEQKSVATRDPRVTESQGQREWTESESPNGRIAKHTFSYNETQVNDILRVGAAIAKQRRTKLTFVVKSNGVPTISQLWTDAARSLASEFGIATECLDMDYAVFQLIQSPTSFDVIVTPNLCGDILADAGGVLLGSRGLCYGASYSADGAAVYQTNHGAAYDLAGTDRANPVGQIHSLSMMLHESFGLTKEASLLNAAITQVWKSGYRTFDVMEAGCQLVGTQEMTRLIVQALPIIAKS